MSISKSFNGTTYIIPEEDETGWGTEVTNLLADVADNAATLATTQTLTNKTLTSPTITNPTITGTVTGALILATGTTVGTLTLANGSITDSGGSISFGNETLTTTGTITGATGSAFGTLTLADGSITDSGGAISFGNETLATTGSVAVGSSSILSNVRLQVVGTNRPLATDDTANLMVGVSDTATDNYGGSIGFQHNGASGVMIAAIKAGRQTGTTGGGFLSFATRTDVAFATERMRITSEGNVTIGTSTATTGIKLTVDGAAQFGQAADGIVLENSTGSFGVSNAAYIRRNSSSGDLEIYASSSASRNLIFGSSSGAEDMRIDSSGSVGIGTTPVTTLTVNGITTFQTSGISRGSIDYDAGDGVLRLNGAAGATGGIDLGPYGSGLGRTVKLHPNYTAFYMSAGEQARIDANGLRIGTTAEVVTSSGGELLSLQGSATKTALSIKGSDVTNIHSWNTGSSAATRYHLTCWNPAGSQEFHLRRETDASIRLAALQAALQLDGNSYGIYFKDNANFEDNIVQRPILKDYGETSTSPSSSVNAITLDIANGNNFQVTLTENITTVTISNPTASGSLCTITVRIVQGAGPYTITWPASFKWPGAIAGTLSTGSGDVDILTAVTWDGGTTWNAVLNNTFS